MARLEIPTEGPPLSLGRPAGWDTAAPLAARAGTFFATALGFVGLALVGAVLVAFGLVLATVAAPLLAAVAGFATVRADRARGLPLLPA